jgi:hypothetical protein
VREIRLNPEVTASGERTTLHTGQIQVHVSFPSGRHTAAFILDTAAIDYWNEFCNMVTAVLQTVSFS